MFIQLVIKEAKLKVKVRKICVFTKPIEKYIQAASIAVFAGKEANKVAETKRNPCTVGSSHLCG